MGKGKALTEEVVKEWFSQAEGELVSFISHPLYLIILLYVNIQNSAYRERIVTGSTL